MQLGCLCKNVIFQLFLTVKLYCKLIWTHHMCQQLFHSKSRKILLKSHHSAFFVISKGIGVPSDNFVNLQDITCIFHCSISNNFNNCKQKHFSLNALYKSSLYGTYISTEQISVRPELIGSVVQQTWGEGQVSSNGSEFESSYYSWK